MSAAILSAGALAVGALVAAPVSPATAADSKAITPDQAIKRGESWMGKIDYSMDAYTGVPDGNWRTDCSGFVSMAWNANTSYTTESVHEVAKKISWAEAGPGDAIVMQNDESSSGIGHIILIVKKEGGTLQTMEQTPPKARTGTYSIDAMSAQGYDPIRYEGMRVVSAEDVRKRFKKEIKKPGVFDTEFGPTIQPVNATTMTQFPTIFYLKDTKYAKRLYFEDADVEVDVEASSLRYSWIWGDGTRPLKTREPEDGAHGKPYPQKPRITHKYTVADVFTPQIQVTWGDLRYRIVGDPEWLPVPNEPWITTTHNFQDVTVRESHGRLVE